ncbi:zinc finger, CCHC-type containing protein [Tanacetum coccineum]
MERFENAIFKLREEINDRMAEMFRLLKELTTREEEKNDKDDIAAGDDIERPNGTDTEMPVKEADKENEAKNGTKNEPIKKFKKKQAVEAPSSQPVEYYLKHRINQKLIKGLLDNYRFSDSLSGVQVGKIKGKTYNLSPRGPVYEVILKKKITKKEDIGGNFEIPCNIGRIAEDVLVDVDGYVYPMDFVILDIKKDEKRPFILGIPFLTMAKAVIKFDKGTIALRSGKSKISFHRIPEPLCKAEKGIKNDIKPRALTMTVNRLVLEWEEKIKLHQEKEMKFDQWRSKNFKNKRPALVKVEDEIDNEGEVT